MGALKFSAMLRIVLIVLLWGVAGITNATTTILVFGDSLSAGYGLPQSAGWVNLLQKRLDREKHDYKVANASLSGETTVGGKNRLGAALAQHQPSIVVLELGINDGARGANIAIIRANLTAMIADCRRHGAKVLLVGMRLPPNYGSDYAGKFQRMYAELARSQRVPLVPFLFEGFAADSGAFQSENMHPNAGAQPLMLDTVWKQLQPLLARRSKQ
jgi:acyl-CoA thioesterase-1